MERGKVQCSRSGESNTESGKLESSTVLVPQGEHGTNSSTPLAPLAAATSAQTLRSSLLAHYELQLNFNTLQNKLQC